jgi:predicted nucleotide-binding protein
MKERFEGDSDKRVLLEVLQEQKLVAGDVALAEALTTRIELLDIAEGNSIIQQGASDNDVYFILAGEFQVIVNGKAIARRAPGDHVGEMAAVQPTQTRAATIQASAPSVVAKLREADLVEVGRTFPDIWRRIAKELAKRLLQRNQYVCTARERIRVFIISSAEALEIARAVQNAFEHDGFHVVCWSNDTFIASHYPIESLEQELDVADFAIAIAQPDDLVKVRGSHHVVPRDNVIFELGFFMGRLGRHRALLMEPRGEDVKLPTDLSGITTIPYRYATDRELAAAIAPACNRIRSIIKQLGPNN